MLYCLAILREHTSPLGVCLAGQLASLHQPGQPLHTRPEFRSHAKQVGRGGLGGRAPGVGQDWVCWCAARWGI